MSIFIIGYDLHSGQNYKNLEDAIKSYGTWWHCLDSTWLIKTSQSSVQVRDNLLEHIKNNDRLLVISYGDPNATSNGQAAWFGFDDACGKWLLDQL